MLTLVICLPRQVQSLTHRPPQLKGGTAPEASLLLGAAPAKGAPGEQGPAGRYFISVMRQKKTAASYYH